MCGLQLFGLRNDGYSGTRHNVGEAFLDCLHARLSQHPHISNVTQWKLDNAVKGLVCTASVPDESLALFGLSRQPLNLRAGQSSLKGASSKLFSKDVTSFVGSHITLIKPRGFMNESGEPVAKALAALKPSSFCVVHDGKCFRLIELVSETEP